MGRVDLQFANASCAHCARLVRQSLEKANGVKGVEIDRFDGRLSVDFDPDRISVDSICSVMGQIGYPTRLFSEGIIPLQPRSFAGRAA